MGEATAEATGGVVNRDGHVMPEQSPPRLDGPPRESLPKSFGGFRRLVRQRGMRQRNGSNRRRSVHFGGSPPCCSECALLSLLGGLGLSPLVHFGDNIFHPDQLGANPGWNLKGNLKGLSQSAAHHD